MPPVAGVFLIAVVIVTVFLLADRIAVVMAWLDFTFNGWIWGERDPVGGKAGRRTFFRWALRAWALGAMAFLAWLLVAGNA